MRDGIVNVEINDFGKFIQKLRLNKGLPQKVISGKLGISAAESAA